MERKTENLKLVLLRNMVCSCMYEFQFTFYMQCITVIIKLDLINSVLSQLSFVFLEIHAVLDLFFTKVSLETCKCCLLLFSEFLLLRKQTIRNKIKSMKVKTQNCKTADLGVRLTSMLPDIQCGFC